MLEKINFVLFALCISIAYCQWIPWPPKEFYQDQAITHFTFPTIERGFTNSFKQRILYEDRWYKPGGPVFFYCGNEGNIEGFWNNTGFMFELAPKLNALIIFGEHRYYGKSLPFESSYALKQPFVQFLSIEEALADYAYMIPYVKNKFNATDSKVIAFGGSYGGCLAAYMRFKYPNIVTGSLAASCPIGWVAGTNGFHQFFETITRVFQMENPQSVAIVRQAFASIQSYANMGPQGFQVIQSKLNICNPVTSQSDVTYAMKWLRNGFVMMAMMNYPYAASFMGDLPAHPVRVAASILVNNAKDPIVGLRKAAAVFYGNLSCFSPTDLYIECSDITGCGLGSDAKAWDFQACTEMKLYDDSNATSSDMFPSLPLTFREVSRYCMKTWEIDRASEQLKLLLWGNDVRLASNIIFSNGDLDPWGLGGILSNSSVGPNSVALIVKGGAHHLDLRSSNPADPPGVKTARAIEENWIRNWLIDGRR